MKYSIKKTHAILAVSVLAFISGCSVHKPSDTDTNANRAVVSDNTAVIPKNIKFDKNWVDRLESFKPAIRACLIKQKDTAVITYAAPINNNKALVYLQSMQGQNHECVADLGKGSVDSVTPLANIPKDIPKLYPVGRKVGACKSPITKKDSNNRVMCVVCSA